MQKTLITLVLAAQILSISGCANNLGPAEKSGTLLGTAAGAIIGSQFGHGAGHLVGASVGAAAGAAIGNVVGEGIDRRSSYRNGR